IPMAPTAESIILEPWKRADAVLWSGRDSREPALYLRVPQALVSPEQRIRLLGSFLQEAERVPLPERCDAIGAFWVYAVATGEIETLFLAFTSEGHGLPGRSFGFFHADFSLAYLEALEMQPSTAREAFWAVGPSTRPRQHLLDLYRSWC